MHPHPTGNRRATFVVVADADLTIPPYDIPADVDLLAALTGHAHTAMVTDGHTPGHLATVSTGPTRATLVDRLTELAIADITITNTPAPGPAELTVDQLQTALRNGADGTAERAAIDLLITGTPYLITPNRPDILKHVIVGNTVIVGDAGRYAQIDWDGLLTDVDQHRIPLSRAERQIVDIAISLALPGTVVALGTALTGLDDVAAGAVLGAIRAVLQDGAR